METEKINESVGQENTLTSENKIQKRTFTKYERAQHFKNNVQSDKVVKQKNANTQRNFNQKQSKTAEPRVRNFGPKGKGLQVMFFGGVGKVGDNITALRYGDDILVIDCGVGFAEPDMPGVDLVIPDMTWLKQHKEMIKGICITHAHEDHIGSLPYFLDEVKAPVYASKLSIALIESKLREFPKIKMKGYAMNPGNAVNIGCFNVEFIHVNHSIAGAYALAITTPVGLVFVSGDFKIDFTPIAGDTTDLSRMGELGRKGVLLMMCESTNIERPGTAMSERVVGETLAEIMEESRTNRIIITSFASNVHRVQQIMDLARKFGRKVAFAGRSMINTMELAMKIGEIKFDHKQIIDIDRVDKYADNEILILATGSQGQEHTALDRMVNGEMANIRIGTNDTVIFSSSPVPGNEKSVTNIINQLILQGAKVIYDDLSDVHASGHACQTEFMIVHKLIRPKFFMPMHGEVKHLKYHEQFAIKMGIKPQNIIVPHVGSVIEVTPNTIKPLPDVEAGEKIVDGKTVCDLDNSVLRDRLQLAEDGICVVVLGINKSTGKLASGPELIPRGFIYPNEIGDILREARQVIVDAMGQNPEGKQDWNEIKNTVKKVLTNLFFKRTHRKPMIIPIMLEV